MSWRAATCLLALAAAFAPPGFAQPELEAMQARIAAKIQAFSANPDSNMLGGLTGLALRQGPARRGESNVRTIQHLGDTLVVNGYDPSSGELFALGYAEARGTRFDGWWALACLDCCPGVSWWDRGTLSRVPDKSGARVHIVSKKMDPRSCKLTQTPDLVDIDLKFVHGLDFKEVAPGKLIYMIGAPAVGNQRAQFKAMVVPRWNLDGLGVVRYISVATKGQSIQKESTLLKGEYRFVTEKPGKYDFMLVGYDKNKRPLHVEIRSIDLPGIPGISR